MANQRNTERDLRNERMWLVYITVLQGYDPEVRSQLTRKFIFEKVKEKGPYFISIQTIGKELSKMLKDKGLMFSQIPKQ